jgi:hypothetical protein
MGRKSLFGSSTVGLIICLCLFLIPKELLSQKIEIVASGQHFYLSRFFNFANNLDTLAKEKPDRIKLMGCRHDAVMRFQNLYISESFDQDSRKKLAAMNESDLKSAEVFQKSVSVIETATAFLVVRAGNSDRMSKIITELLNDPIIINQRGEPWNDLVTTEGKEGFVEIDPTTKIGYVRITSKPWLADNHWHLAFCITYDVVIDGEPVSLNILSKEFGSVWRASTFLKRTKTENPGNLILSADSGIRDETVPDAEDGYKLLHESGIDIIAAGYGEIVFKKDVVDKYLKNKSGSRHIDFLSINVFEKSGKEEKLAYKPYVIKEFSGIKVGVIGITDPEITKRIDQAGNINHPGLKMVIKDPKIILSKEIMPEVASKADFIVVLANMSAESIEKIADSLYGTDLVIGKLSHLLTENNNRLTVQIDKYKGRNPRLPLLFSKVSFANINKIEVEIKNGNLNIEEKKYVLDARYESPEPFEKVWENARTLGLVDKKDLLLPDHRKLYPNIVKKSRVSEDEGANLIAETIRRATRSEIGINRIHQHRANYFGDLDAGAIRSWITEDDKLEVVYLSGAALLELKNMMPTLEGTDRLALAGYDDKGGINGIPLHPNELYRVAVSSCISEVQDDYPPFKKGINKTFKLKWTGTQYVEDVENGAPVPLSEAVIAYLKFERDHLYKSAEDKRIAILKNRYEGKPPERYGQFIFNLNEISFDFSKLDQRNNASFTDVSDSRIQSSSQYVIGGKLDLSLNYLYKNLLVESGSKLAYSTIKIYYSPTESVSNEMNDKLNLYSGLFYSMWRPEKQKWLGNIGPFARFSYDSEFHASSGNPRRQYFNLMTGLKTIEGNYLKSLSFGHLLQSDFTGDRESVQNGFESDFLLGKEFSGNLFSWKTEGILKYLFNSASDTTQDLKLSLSINTSFLTKLIGDFSMGPFFNYFLYTAKTFNATGQQFYYGISLRFARKDWKIGYQPFIF